ncbi:MAG TPA: hypothetical protein VMV10_28295 [Pirellulales bacterium]|nr:hypothetical protein [Pirellulales bacterium]
MQRIASQFACWVVLLLPGAALAEPPRSSQLGAPRATNERPAAVADASVRQSADTPPQVPAAERWRYRYQNGHWWYWGKTGAWSFWTGSRWVAYSSDSYRRWYREWRLAKNEAELARLKAIIRSMEARPRPRSSWIRDPDSYFPFSSERGNFP